METLTPTTLCDRCHYTLSPSDRVNDSLRETIPAEALHSSYVPTETERIQALSRLQDEQLLLQQYDREIPRLRAIVLKLKAERNLLRQRIEERRCSISVMKKIPVELWCKIFSFACAMHDYALVIRGGKITATTRDLSHVCHRWREIVTGLPHVWSTLFIEFPGHTRDYRPLLEVYLRNSKEVPLTLRIEGPLDSTAVSDSGLEEDNGMGEIGTSAFRTLMQHLPRFESLELDLNPHLLSVISIPAELPNSLSLPHLHSFFNFVEMSDDEALTDQNRWFWDAIRCNAPNLSVVQTFGLHDIRLLPCSQLTSLHLRHVGNVNGLLHMIDAAHNLRILTIEEMDDFDDTDLIAVPVVSSLRELTILSDLTPPTSLANLLSFLTLPYLKSISLKCEYKVFQSATKGEGDWATSLVDMLRRNGHAADSPCCMKKISLDLTKVDDFSGQFLTNILQCCPKLAQVELKLYPNGDAPSSLHTSKLLSDLAISATETDATTPTNPPPPILAPKLKRLKIRESVKTLTVDGMEAIVRMAESRAFNRLRSRGSGATLLSRVAFEIQECGGGKEQGQEEQGVDHWNEVFGSRLRALEEAGTKCLVRRV